MKVLTKDILPFQEDEFFSPIRSKVDYAKILMSASRNLLLEYELGALVATSKMKLVIDRMSRLFFFGEAKYFSISFPFSVQINDNKITSIASYSGKEVDFRSISSVVSILENEQFLINTSPIDFYVESSQIESIGLLLLEEIFQFEPGYVRYDNDPENANGKLHPEFHIDVNYSNYGTYKLGLSKNISIEYLENLINLNTDCSFITD